MAVAGTKKMHTYEARYMLNRIIDLTTISRLPKRVISLSLKCWLTLLLKVEKKTELLRLINFIKGRLKENKLFKKSCNEGYILESNIINLYLLSEGLSNKYRQAKRGRR